MRGEKEKAYNIGVSARTFQNTNINNVVIKVAQTIHLKICGRHKLERTENGMNIYVKAPMRMKK